jgi:hypothetical protein
MSLYSHKEICKGCNHAVFHECCNTFCRCKEHHENEVNTVLGDCYLGTKFNCVYESDNTTLAKCKHCGNSKE